MVYEIYRLDYAYDTVYKYDADQKAYYFYSKLSELTKEEIKEMEKENDKQENLWQEWKKETN